VVISFIGEWKPEYPQSTRIKLTNFITQCCIEHTSPETDSNLQVSGDMHWLHR